MQCSNDMLPPAVRWDLSTFFSGMDDPHLATTWEQCLERARNFEQTYRGKINDPDLTVDRLLEALKEIEAIYQEATKPVSYANLLFACDAGNHEIGAFLQKQMEKITELNVLTLFFELELQSIPKTSLNQFASDPLLSNYRHYLELAEMLSPHRLSEKEEVLIEETANTGNRAWVRLFEEITSNHHYRYHAPDASGSEDLSQEEVLDLFHDPDRAVRQAAADCLTQGLGEIQRIVCFIYNNLIQDKKVEDRLRKYDYPEHSRHLGNELDKTTVDLVVGLCKEKSDLVSRFYRVKREILGYEQLTHIDRYAPLFEAQELISFEEGRDLVLDAFGRFSSEMRDRAKEFFDRNWIDAEPRPGKQGGAFCSSQTPDTHPVIFLSYMNKLDNVSTLAHELGHGVHASLSRGQTLLNFHGTLPMAELASTFGEMLVFERLVDKANLKDKLALYAQKIENSFATVFRQSAMFHFEQRCHETIRAQGEMPADAFGEIWQEEIQSMFGDSLTLGEQHKGWWGYVEHFFETPFYVYAYSFGELLVLSLYQLAKSDGAEFERKYLDLLRLGGSKTPFELMETVGVDLKDRGFWLGGFRAMERLVEEFERLWAEYSEKGKI